MGLAMMGCVEHKSQKRRLLRNVQATHDGIIRIRTIAPTKEDKVESPCKESWSG